MTRKQRDAHFCPAVDLECKEQKEKEIKNEAQKHKTRRRPGSGQTRLYQAEITITSIADMTIFQTDVFVYWCCFPAGIIVSPWN
jgi:hypothetical protein